MDKNKIDLNASNFELDFLQDDLEHVEAVNKQNYKVIISDDDEEMHTATTVLLKNYAFEGKNLEFIHAYSGEETLEKLKAYPDAAIILLDVVMEENDTGLKIVEHIRNVMNNKMIRIILRTGQPGEAPEDHVIVKYDINDYRLKTELTVQRLHTSMYEALRSYRDIKMLDNNKRGLEKIIKMTSSIFTQTNLNEFYKVILEQLLQFRDESSLCFRIGHDHGGIVFIKGELANTVIAATGNYEVYLNRTLNEIEALAPLFKRAQEMNLSEDSVVELEKGLLIGKQNVDQTATYIFIEADFSAIDMDLIKVFLSNYALALDNYYVHQEMLKTQTQLILKLGNTIEKRSQDTAYHVNRVSKVTKLLGLKLGLTETVASYLEMASSMHDVGKVGIPDAILLKPGKFTEEEYEIMKSHSNIGYQIFNESDLEVMKYAAVICRYHHERYDGLGYPLGLMGDAIPLFARIVAVADVFDALTHVRCYKEAWTFDDAMQYLLDNKNTQFDPVIIDVLMRNQDELKEILIEFPN